MVLGAPGVLGALGTLGTLAALGGQAACWSRDDGPGDPPARRTLSPPSEAEEDPEPLAELGNGTGAGVAPGAAPGSAAGTGLRVATYNIAGGRLGLRRVERTLRRLRADVIALQEVSRDLAKGAAGDQAAQLARALGMRHLYGAHRMQKTPEEGLALLSRYPLSGLVVVPTPPGRRVFLQAVVHAPRGRLTVLVLHLRAVGLSRGARRAQYRAQRRVEAILVASHAARQKGPLLAMGDLNDTPGSRTLGLLVPPLARACSGEKTWPSGLPFLQLDHILTRAPVRSQGCRAVLSIASDHRPLVTEIDW